MIKEYLKILTSITMSLFVLATVISLFIGLVELFGRQKFDSMLFPYLIAGIGFVMFGLVGSLLWFLILALINKIKAITFEYHVVSAVISTVLTIGGFGLYASGFNLDKFLDAYIFLIFVAPVVIGSLVIYKKYFSL